MFIWYYQRDCTSFNCLFNNSFVDSIKRECNFLNSLNPQHVQNRKKVRRYFKTESKQHIFFALRSRNICRETFCPKLQLIDRTVKHHATIVSSSTICTFFQKPCQMGKKGNFNPNCYGIVGFRDILRIKCDEFPTALGATKYIPMGILPS